MANITRRVIRHGKNSLTVVIPKAWAVLNNISEKDNVTLSQGIDGSLVLKKAEVQENDTKI